MLENQAPDIVVDNIELNKSTLSEACGAAATNLVTNGDASYGDATNWYGWSNPVGVTADGSGYGGSGKALRAYGRSSTGGYHWQGIAYHINPACAVAGETWRVTFKTRLVLEGTSTGVNCDPSIPNNSDCPLVRIHTYLNNQHGYIYVLDSAMQWDTNAWNTFNTTFTVPNNAAGDGLEDFRPVFAGGPAGTEIWVDNVEMYREV